MHQKECIGLYINIASHLIRRRTDALVSSYGLTGIQSRIISYLDGAQDKAVFQKDIETQFGIRRSSVTSVITNLEQNGFLIRRPVPGDARLKQLLLTENGHKVACEMSRHIHELELILSSSFTGPEQTQFLDMLKKIIDKLRQEDEPLC